MIYKKPKDLHQDANPVLCHSHAPPNVTDAFSPCILIYMPSVHRSRIDCPPSVYFRPFANRYSLSLASMILFPPILFTLFTSSTPESSAATSSPPPILLPLINTFGTVLRPVVFSRAVCNSAPSECSSNSTTKGAGTIVYLSSKIAFAFFE